MRAQLLLLNLDLFVVNVEIAFERVLAFNGFFQLVLRYHKAKNCCYVADKN